MSAARLHPLSAPIGQRRVFLGSCCVKAVRRLFLRAWRMSQGVGTPSDPPRRFAGIADVVHPCPEDVLGACTGEAG